jgi:hypothetical protein
MRGVVRVTRAEEIVEIVMFCVVPSTSSACAADMSATRLIPCGTLTTRMPPPPFIEKQPQAAGGALAWKKA